MATALFPDRKGSKGMLTICDFHAAYHHEIQKYRVPPPSPRGENPSDAINRAENRWNSGISRITQSTHWSARKLTITLVDYSCVDLVKIENRKYKALTVPSSCVKGLRSASSTLLTSHAISALRISCSAWRCRKTRVVHEQFSEAHTYFV